MNSNAKNEDIEEEYDDYNEGFDKEKDEDGGGGGLSEVQQMLLASVENNKKLLGSGKKEGMIDVSERSDKSSTSQKKGVDTSERSGSVSSKKSTKSKSSSKGRKKKKIYSIDGDKLGISLHDEESCDKIDMSDRSAMSERPRSTSSGGGLSSELDTFILKNKKAARKNGGSVSHASHISGASQVSTKDEVVKSQVIKKKGSKSPYRKGGQPPPPPPPPKKHSPSNSSSSFGSKKLLSGRTTPSSTKRPKDEQHRNKSISSSQTTTETSSTTPTGHGVQRQLLPRMVVCVHHH